MKNITVQIFNFNELSEKSKKRVIDNHSKFLSEIWDSVFLEDTINDILKDKEDLTFKDLEINSDYWGYFTIENEFVNEDVKKEIEKWDVIRLGVHGIHLALWKEFDEELPLPKLYYAKSKHYSWHKAVDIIGIGQSQIIEIDIDNGYRMDIESFKSKFDYNSPTLAVIGILGSSKQGSIDPIDDIVEFASGTIFLRVCRAEYGQHPRPYRTTYMQRRAVICYNKP